MAGPNVERYHKMQKYMKSEYDRNYKYYDDLYMVMHGVNVHTARARKKQMESHTPFVWDEERFDDIPNVPSDNDWMEVFHDKNVPGPSSTPTFKRKHRYNLALYDEQQQMMRRMRDRNIDLSPKRSLSCDCGMEQEVEIRRQEKPPSPPAHNKPASRPKSQGTQDTIEKQKKGVQTPNWEQTKGGKKRVIGRKLGASGSRSDTNVRPPFRPCCAHTCKPRNRDLFKETYVVSRDAKFENAILQPLIPFGYGNNNDKTARKMTANVKAPCDVYATSLSAAKAQRGKQQVQVYKEVGYKPEMDPRVKPRKGTPYDTEYHSNFKYPNQQQIREWRMQREEVYRQARKSNGMYRGPK